MLKLDIPIYIFQGLEDGNTSSEGTFDIEKRFAGAKKANLHCFYFKNYNHDLNYTDWSIKKIISPDISKIFEIAESIIK